jgi:hypothetical protein
MFIHGDYKPKWSSDFALETDMLDGKITADSDEYKQILGLVKYCEANAEARH